MTTYRRFIVVFFVPLLLAMPLGLANYVFLLNAGELDAVEDIVGGQRRSGGLYGTAVHNNTYAYKLALYASRRPQVVVIGSSRVLQFRDAYFTQSFVNLGRTVDYPKEAEKLIADILGIAKPKLVLFGIDYWWGNPRWAHAYTFKRHRERGGELTPDAMLAPTNWLIEGKLSLDTYLGVIRGGHPAKVDDVEMYGVQAIALGNGFGPDGSYYYSGMIYGRDAAYDAGFKNTLRRIDTDKGQFRYGSDVMDERIESLRAALAQLEEAGVRTITFLPPLAPAIADAVREKGARYAYIAEFRERVARLSRHHYDFHDPRSLGANNCEFVDGFHSGEVVLARMLAIMADDAGNGLASVVDMEKVRAATQRHVGKVLVEARYRRDGEREVDFLGLGCDKT